MENFKRQVKKNRPSEIEMQIFHRVKALFNQVSQENAETYSSFLISRDPCEREVIARRIQALEESVIREVAREYELSVNDVAEAFFKVDALICEPPTH